MRERHRLLFWAALGAGILLKGPVVVIVCGGTIALLFLLDRRLAWLWRIASLGGVALFLGITLPWLVAIAHATRGAFFVESIGHDMLAKVLTGQEGHGAPPGYHLLAFLIAFWPFSLFACLGVPWVWQERRRPEVRFCLAWILPAWILFELVATKLPHYVLPVYPAIALLTSAAVTEGATAGIAATRPRLVLVLAGLWLFLGFLLAIVVAGAPAALEGMVDWTGVVAGAALMAAIGTAASLLRRQQPAPAAATLLVALLILYPVVFARILPPAESLWVSRRVASLVEQVRPCRESTVAAVGYHEPSLVFLLGTRTRLVSERLAAHHLLTDPDCALALVPSAGATEFDAVLAGAGITPRAIGGVAGVNYSKGQRVSLTLYRLGKGAAPQRSAEGR